MSKTFSARCRLLRPYLSPSHHKRKFTTSNKCLVGNIENKIPGSFDLENAQNEHYRLATTIRPPQKTTTEQKGASPKIKYHGLKDGGLHINGYNRVIAKPQAILLPLQDAPVNNGLNLVYKNVVLNRIDMVYLRDTCTCTQCIDEHSGQKKFASHAIPRNIAIKSVDFEIDLKIRVTWSYDIPGFENHVSIFDLNQLHKAAAISRRGYVRPAANQTWWDEKFMKRKFELVAYNDFMNDASCFHDAVEKLGQLGLIFLKDVPGTEFAVEEIAQKLGPIRNTFYGKTWDVKDKPKAENVAYTSGYLGMHMDLLYMKEPPGIQLLHCIESSCKGGESMFIDSFWAAKTLFDYAPQLFEDLTTFPVTFHYNANGYYYNDEKPTIELCHGHTMDDLYRNFYLANVNWSPPFQGPFTSDIGLNDRGRKLRNYLQAAQAFAGIVDNPENHFLHRLDPGQCVIFDNRRVLHGRKAFDISSGQRWLKGAYVDKQDFISTFLKRKEKLKGKVQEGAEYPEELERMILPGGAQGDGVDTAKSQGAKVPADGAKESSLPREDSEVFLGELMQWVQGLDGDKSRTAGGRDTETDTQEEMQGGRDDRVPRESAGIFKDDESPHRY